MSLSSFHRVPTAIGLALLFSVALLGCDSGEEAPPKTDTSSTSVGEEGGAIGKDGSAAKDSSTAPPAKPTRSEGCGTQGVSLGWKDDQPYDVNGTTAYYIHDLPGDYDPNKAYPVVFGFHGTGGGNWTIGIEEDDVARGDVLFFYPKAPQKDPGDIYSKDWMFARNLEYFDALFDYVTSTYCVDLNRVFVTGFSYGADFAQTLACDRGHVLRGAAILAGGGRGSREKCKGDPALWFGVDKNDSRNSTEKALNSWLTRRACGKDETGFSPAPPCVQYADCPGNEPIVYCLREGSEHAPPSYARASAWALFSNLK
ncbi:MAG: hypothetical protein KC416_12050 [Myxococcales bacterium]|nr:hypothetical protein [Myxococcales bacterium]